MPLRILHTADWHLGQTFYEYDRSYEHACFLKWLIRVISEKEADVLLICGDIFDVSNPSATSLRMFYNFLIDAARIQPHLQVVCIAGNHDSAARLESPGALLEAFNVKVIGSVELNPDKTIRFDKLAVPLKNREGETEAWCLAVPFLRPGDYPGDEGYSRGVESVYHRGVAYLNSLRNENQVLISLGHLHALNAGVSEDDKSERKILGGLEFVPATAFPPEIAYTALGHIHRPQEVAGRPEVRYSGSPLPMSFSELTYHHQVVYIETEGKTIRTTEILSVPVTAGLLSVPRIPKVLEETIRELQELPEADGNEKVYPYLQVRVLLTGPEPSLRHQIDTAIAGKAVRLARIEVAYPAREKNENMLAFGPDDIKKIQPLEIFRRRYAAKYQTEVPGELVELFMQVTDELENVEPESAR
jgi:exonuclease SbcD